jgi:hypothetical protein
MSESYASLEQFLANKNLVISVVLVTVLVVMMCGRTEPQRRPAPRPAARSAIGRPERQVLEMNYTRAMEESGERYDLDQAVDRMRGRIIITNQPETRVRSFDLELDGVGASINDTF